MLFVPTRLAPSPVHGLGLFALESIRRGTVVWRFTAGFDLDLDPALVQQQTQILRETLLHYGYIDPRLNRFILCCDNARFINHSNVPNIAPDFDDPQGVPIDAIIFGGRASDREPLIRAITDLAEGVYDGLTLGAEATFAAEGVDGLLRYDPMSMRPFMSYPEGAYAAHWLGVIGAATSQPIFAHVNWFQRDPEDGHYLWPGYRDNLRPLLWLLRLQEGEVRGRPTPVGTVPVKDELDLDGVDISPRDLETILTIDIPRWRQEMKYRGEHLEQFADLPEEIWQAHYRVAAALDEAD